MNNILHPNHPYQYRNRRIDLASKLNSKDALAAFIKELELAAEQGYLLPEGIGFRNYRIRTLLEAEWVLSTLNRPDSRFNSLINLQVYHQAWQRWDFLSSNLGTGFIFFFVCGNCERLARYLYMPDGQHRYLCRQCHKLNYPTARQKRQMLRA